MFRDLPRILSPSHFLVVNNSKVIPARLKAHRPGRKERIEILLTRRIGGDTWTALTRPARKAPAGQELKLAADLWATVLRVEGSGRRILRFAPSGKLEDLLPNIGETPLPPYIRRQAGEERPQDRERYQTIYARHEGSVAAPTAGLHFSEEAMRRLEDRGIRRCEILLHIGYGTFQPIRERQVEKHLMEEEFYRISAEAADFIRERKSAGGSLVAVGTTTTRALEFASRAGSGQVQAGSGWCDLFIYPGFRFQAVDALLTNFHLPGSTLLLLVSAFAGRDFILECYREAVSRDYRFYSYGDCMLIL